MAMARPKRLMKKSFKINGRVILMVFTGTIVKETQQTYNSFSRLLYVNKFPFYMPFLYRSNKGNAVFHVYPLDYVGALKYLYKEVLGYVCTQAWSYPPYTKGLIGKINEVITQCTYDYGEVRDEYDLTSIEVEFPEFRASRAMDYILEIRRTYGEQND